MPIGVEKIDGKLKQLNSEQISMKLFSCVSNCV
jgi:hypothetical protein